MAKTLTKAEIKLAKKEASEASAKDIYRRLMMLKDARDPERSNNQWATDAGVNKSFFTNVGAGSKAPSDPAVNNLRLILQAIGSSLPEFFLHEAKGRLVQAPTRQALEKALFDALVGMPAKKDERAAYLAKIVLSILGLPESQPATPDSEHDAEKDAPGVSAPVRPATKRV